MELLILLLLVLWVIGALGHIAGGFVHLLLVIALIVFIYNQVVGRRS